VQEVLTYPQYVNLARKQVNYVKDVTDALSEAANNLSSD